MRFEISSILALLPAVALAQYGDSSAVSSTASTTVATGAEDVAAQTANTGSSSTGSSTTVSASATATVMVGKNDAGEVGNYFSPEMISAEKDAVLVFEFYQGGHSVASSPFAAPCSNNGTFGFFSGQFNTTGDLPNSQAFVYTVQSTDTPTWLFCGHVGHCQGGMAAVINQATTPENQNTLAKYKESAAKTNQTVLAKKEPFGDGTQVKALSDLSSSSTNASASTSTSTSTSTATTSSETGSGTSTGSSSTSSTPSEGTIPGVAWAGLVVAGLVALCFGGL